MVSGSPSPIEFDQRSSRMVISRFPGVSLQRQMLSSRRHSHPENRESCLFAVETINAIIRWLAGELNCIGEEHEHVALIAGSAVRSAIRVLCREREREINRGSALAIFRSRRDLRRLIQLICQRLSNADWQQRQIDNRRRFWENVEARRLEGLRV